MLKEEYNPTESRPPLALFKIKNHLKSSFIFLWTFGIYIYLYIHIYILFVYLFVYEPTTDSYFMYVCML